MTLNWTESTKAPTHIISHGIYTTRDRGQRKFADSYTPRARSLGSYICAIHFVTVVHTTVVGCNLTIVAFICAVRTRCKIRKGVRSASVDCIRDGLAYTNRNGGSSDPLQLGLRPDEPL